MPRYSGTYVGQVSSAGGLWDIAFAGPAVVSRVIYLALGIFINLIRMFGPLLRFSFIYKFIRIIPRYILFSSS
jgi:hypothetical protein